MDETNEFSRKCAFENDSKWRRKSIDFDEKIDLNKTDPCILNVLKQYALTR
jgi:hypothetical protein